MILVINGIICVMHPPDTLTIEEDDHRGGKVIYRRIVTGSDGDFLAKVFSTKDTRGDDGSAST